MIEGACALNYCVRILQVYLIWQQRASMCRSCAEKSLSNTDTVSEFSLCLLVWCRMAMLRKMKGMPQNPLVPPQIPALWDWVLCPPPCTCWSLRPPWASSTVDPKLMDGEPSPYDQMDSHSPKEQTFPQILKSEDATAHIFVMNFK